MITQEITYRPRGAAKRLFKTRAREAVLSGPAGTGKSRAIGEYLNYLCEEYPGIRVCVARKTLESLRSTFQVTFEEKVLWPGHPLLRRNLQRDHRQSYVYENGARIDLHGFNNITRLFSSEYDVAYVQECTELTEDEWQSLLRAIRNNVLPWQQILGDCNPDSPTHWLRGRMDSGTTTELVSKHEDNPSLTAEYLAGLKSLVGPMYDRLYLGLWKAAEGAVLPEFSMARHGIDTIPPAKICWTFLSADWGYTAPGAMAVIGVDAEGELYRLAEIYRRGELLDWWVERACELEKEFNLAAMVGDPARPDAIDAVNARLAEKRSECRMRPADNKRASSGPGDLSGIDLLKEGFSRDRIHLLRDANRHIDQGLRDLRKPWNSESELPGIVYMATDGKINREHVDSRGPDHAFDIWRYAASFAWGHDYYVPAKRKLPEDTPHFDAGDLDLLGR